MIGIVGGIVASFGMYIVGISGDDDDEEGEGDKKKEQKKEQKKETKKGQKKMATI